jgi:hypothetical protein
MNDIGKLFHYRSKEVEPPGFIKNCNQSHRVSASCGLGRYENKQQGFKRNKKKNTNRDKLRETDCYIVRSTERTPSIILSQAISWCQRSTNPVDERVGWSLPASPISKAFISMQSEVVPHGDDLIASGLHPAALSVCPGKGDANFSPKHWFFSLLP